MRHFRVIPAVVLSLLLCLALSFPAWAEADERDLTPLPEAWFDDTLFLGDSITYVLMQHCDLEGELEGMQIWSEQSLKVCTAAEDTYRFWYHGDAFSLPDLIRVSGAKRVFFCLGINDIGELGGIERTMTLWAKIVGAIREVDPDVQLFFQSCFPMWSVSVLADLNNDTVNAYNSELRRFCEDNGFIFVDLAEYFRGEDGGIREEFSSDAYVHLTMEAAALWVEQLRNPANYSVDPRSLG